jgi:hypothetical protein
MNLRAIGIEPSSARMLGQRVQYSCSLTEAQLRVVLAQLPVGGEVSVPDIGAGECFREARRGLSGFELKRGCHGSYGTWRSASPQEVEAWLVPGLAVAERTCNPGYGVNVEVPA